MTEVLHLIDTYRLGGPGKTIVNCAKFIDRDRYRLHVASFTHPDQDRNEFAAKVRAAGIPFLALPESGRLNLGHIPLLRGYVRSENIRIVHAHGYRSDLFAYLATRWLRGVFVVTTHHGWIRNTLRQRCAARLALWLSTRFDGVEVVSRGLLKELRGTVPRRTLVEVIHNAVVLADYRPSGQRDALRESLSFQPDQAIVGVIGRLSAEKGCLDMIEAFRSIAERVGNAHLLFVGEGPLESVMRSRARSLGLSSRIHFLGHRQDVRQYYEVVDVVVCPSHTEGLSNVILEAQVMGRAVVATSVGGNSDIITDGVNGLLVPHSAPIELGEAVARVLVDDDLRNRLGQDGARRVAAQFGFDRRMREEERFYDALLRKSDPPEPLH